jgi:hypothetical protein
MAISRKPKASAAAPAGVDIDALINKGGSVGGQPSAASAEDGEARPVQVVLRVPADVLSQVDQAIKGRRVRIPRHTWLLEAIAEKLEREGEAPS